MAICPTLVVNRIDPVALVEGPLSDLIENTMEII